MGDTEAASDRELAARMMEGGLSAEHFFEESRFGRYEIVRPLGAGGGAGGARPRGLRYSSVRRSSCRGGCRPGEFLRPPSRESGEAQGATA